jgi:hypothetical protein
MKVRAIALTTSALVAAATLVAPASAREMMGDVRLGLGHNWVDESFGGEGFLDGFSGDIESNFTSFSGAARVNLPYSDTVSIQLDIDADASLDQSLFSGGDAASPAATVFGGHINYRDEDGLLGVFAGAGRVNAIISAPVYMAGFEGQYFTPDWTLSAQVGYLDSDDALLLQNAGMVKLGATYYASPKLKLLGNLAYVDGENGLYGSENIDVTEWAWTLGVHYWFGKSIPVSGFFEYKGRAEELSSSDLGTADVDVHTVSAGVVFHFGGDSFKSADRDGVAVELPDAELFQAIPATGSLGSIF